MKKKILSIMVALITTLSFASCAAQDISVAFDKGEAPWYTTLGYEKSVYKIEKYTRVASGNDTVDDKIIAKGEYTTIIETKGDNYEASASFSLTYENIDEAKDVMDKNTFMDNRGLTDSFKSLVRFNKGQSPIYAEKAWVCATRPEGSLQLTPYSYTADYNANTTTIICGENKKTFALESGTKFDNEQLPYILRAMSAIKTGGSSSFYNVNPYDSYVTDKYVRYQMTATCAKATTGVTIDALSKDKFLIKKKEGEINSENGSYGNIPCIETSVAISAKNSGPAIKFMITDPSLGIIQRSLDDSLDSEFVTRKIIVGMRYIEYNVGAAKEKYNTVYTLANYQIGKITP